MLYSEVLKQVITKAANFQGHLDQAILEELTYRVINENNLDPNVRIYKGRNGKLAQALQNAVKYRIAQ